MKPLLVLLAVFAIGLITTKVVRGSYDFAFSGRVAMSAMLVFTAVAHFVFTKGMAMMLPSFVPFKTQLVHLTGIIELSAAIGLLVPQFKVVTAWLLIVFFILVLPANVHAALKQVDYQNGTFTGNGLSYLWFRVPLQLLFIAWVYVTAIKF